MAWPGKRHRRINPASPWTGAGSYCWGVLTGPRLRQVAVVARDCGAVAGELSQAFGWAQPYHDPGVRQFGLTNAVFAVGHTFLEVVAPLQPDLSLIHI